MRDTGASRKVLEYMSAHPAIEIHYETVADEVGILSANANQALARLANNDNMSIMRVGKGMYKYIPGLAKGRPNRGKETIVGEHYICIGITGRGTILVRSEKDNKTFILQEIDV